MTGPLRASDISKQQSGESLLTKGLRQIYIRQTKEPYTGRDRTNLPVQWVQGGQWHPNRDTAHKDRLAEACRQHSGR